MKCPATISIPPPQDIVSRRRRETEYKAKRSYARRLALIKSLGGKCVECGRKNRLEIDHIEGRDWDPAKKSRWSRVAIYEREAREGKLQVLCKRCNKVKGKP